jgi:hypothetical protein
MTSIYGFNYEAAVGRNRVGTMWPKFEAERRIFAALSAASSIVEAPNRIG